MDYPDWQTPDEGRTQRPKRRNRSNDEDVSPYVNNVSFSFLFFLNFPYWLISLFFVRKPTLFTTDCLCFWRQSKWFFEIFLNPTPVNFHWFYLGMSAVVKTCELNAHLRSSKLVRCYAGYLEQGPKWVKRRRPSPFLRIIWHESLSYVVPLAEKNLYTDRLKRSSPGKKDGLNWHPSPLQSVWDSCVLNWRSSPLQLVWELRFSLH